MNSLSRAILFAVLMMIVGCNYYKKLKDKNSIGHEEKPVILGAQKSMSDSNNQYSDSEDENVVLATHLVCKKGSSRFVIFDKEEKVLKYCKDGRYKDVPLNQFKLVTDGSREQAPSDAGMSNNGRYPRVIEPSAAVHDKGESEEDDFNRSNASYRCRKSPNTDRSYVCQPSH